ncbi:MAG: glycosyltransferase family 2 protein [Acidimicrobiales bacterium]
MVDVGRAEHAPESPQISGQLPPAAPGQPSVTVVIPAMNEAANLAHVVERLPRHCEVILVDGNSVDGTADVMRYLCPEAHIIRQTGRGKGDALRHGFAAATGDIIVMLDADGSTDPAEIPRFIEALIQGADFVKGSRFLPAGGSEDITRLRRAGNWLLSRLVNRIWHVNYTDLCYGYNAFWASCLDTIEADCSGFEVETLMNIQAARGGLRVAEVPSFEYNRIHGSSNLRPLRDGWRVLLVILREWRATRIGAGPLQLTIDLTDTAMQPLEA